MRRDLNGEKHRDQCWTWYALEAHPQHYCKGRVQKKFWPRVLFAALHLLLDVLVFKPTDMGTEGLSCFFPLPSLHRLCAHKTSS